MMNELEEIAKTLVEPEDDFYRLKNSLEEMHRICSGITGIRAFTDDPNRDIMLEQGKAVSPVVAANCLMDLLRTKRFVQGVHRAIIHFERKVRGRAAADSVRRLRTLRHLGSPDVFLVRRRDVLLHGHRHFRGQHRRPEKDHRTARARQLLRRGHQLRCVRLPVAARREASPHHLRGVADGAAQRAAGGADRITWFLSCARAASSFQRKSG